MILKNIIKVSFYLGLCFVFTNVFADTTENSGEMKVQLGNLTGVTCQLSNQDLKHGVFTSAVPKSLTNNDTEIFTLQQSLEGPDVVLTYQCGAGNISFEVQQSYSLVLGHTPKVTIISNQGLTLDKNNTSSSVANGTAGVANITIRSE